MGDDSRSTPNRVGAQDLFVAYREYCKDNQSYCKPISDFNNTMIAVEGVSRVNVGGRKYWTGLRFKTDVEVLTATPKVGSW